MKTYRSVITSGLSLALLAAILASPVLAAKKPPISERYRATATNAQRGAAKFVEIGIRNYSSLEERQSLIRAFQEGGNKQLNEVLSKIKPEKGFIKVGNSSHSLFYIYKAQDGDKKIILMATDRPISMGENMRNTHSRDYSISVVQMVFDEDGAGSGSILPGVEFKVDKEGELVLETYNVVGTKITSIERTE